MSCLKSRKLSNYQHITVKDDTRFTDKELNVLRQRFINMTNGSKYINSQQFQKNLPLLGLESMLLLSDALFNAMDLDQDNQVEFNEFVSYFDKITYGSQEEKAEISFRLIDNNKKGYITYEDFSNTINLLVKSYQSMKGLDDDMFTHLEKKTQEIFNLIDVNHDKQISLIEYTVALTKNPQILDVFEFLKKGVTQTIKESQHRRDQQMLQQFNMLTQQTHQILQSMHEKSHKQQFVNMTKQLIQKQKVGIDLLVDTITHKQEQQTIQWIEDMNEQDLKNKFTEVYLKLQKLEQKATTSMNEIQELYHEQLEKEDIQQPIQQISINNNKLKRNSIQIGNEIWNLVINMMLGIKMSVKSAGIDNFLSQVDFDIKYRFEIMSQQGKCKFYDFAPKVFNQIRKMQMIDNDAYLNSIGPENLLFNFMQGDMSTLSELTSTGKSGSFFYYSQDGLYTLKTISEREFILFNKILYNYYNYLKSEQNSFIIKLFGLHKIIMGNSKIYFIVMGNVFQTEFQIHKKYDLKGSTYKRNTRYDEDMEVARKDLDFINNNEKILIDQSKKQLLIEQLEKDADFLANNNLLDYSLLIGIHQIQQPLLQFNIEPKKINVIKSNDNKFIYFFGIIDILTEYNTKKQVESIVKRLIQGPTISALPPNDYAERFKNFMRQIF